jgi:hypothetical protein
MLQAAQAQNNTTPILNQPSLSFSSTQKESNSVNSSENSIK